MSSIFDDDYVKKQLSIQDENNRKLTEAEIRFGESAIICGINFLEATGVINTTTASIIRGSVNIIETIGKWFKWW